MEGVVLPLTDLEGEALYELFRLVEGDERICAYLHAQPLLEVRLLSVLNKLEKGLLHGGNRA